MTLVSSPPDQGLVRRCLQGDQSAERELFRQNFPRVHATLYRILGSNLDVDDLVQETFIEGFRSLHTFEGRAKLSTWLDRIAVRVAFRHLGRRSREQTPITMVEDLCDPNASSADRIADAREGLRRLYATLDQLNDGARLAFTLHVIDGRPIKEIAALMKASAVATKVRIWRATQFVDKQARRDPVLAHFLSHQPAEDGSQEGQA